MRKVKRFGNRDDQLEEIINHLEYLTRMIEKLHPSDSVPKAKKKKMKVIEVDE